MYRVYLFFLELFIFSYFFLVFGWFVKFVVFFGGLCLVVCCFFCLAVLSLGIAELWLYILIFSSAT